MHNITIVIFAVAAFILVWRGLYVFAANRHAAANRAMFLLCLLFGIADFPQALAHATTTLEEVFLWHHLSWIGWAFFPTVAVYAAVAIAQNSLLARHRWIMPLLYGVAVVFFIRSLASLFGAPLLGIEQFDLQPYTHTYLPCYARTPWDVAYTIYQVTCLLASLVIIGHWGLTTNRRRHRQQAEVIIYSGVLALIIDPVRFWLLPSLGIPVNQLSIIWALEHLIFAIGLSYAITQHRFIVPTATLAANYIVGHVKDLIILAAEDGTILQVNPTAVQLLGWGDTELIGRILPELFYLPETGQAEWPLPGCSLATPSEHEVFFRARTGVEIPVAVTCSYLRDTYGDVIGIIVIGTDLRQTKQLQYEVAVRVEAEEGLRRAHDSLESLVQQRTEELAHANAELIEEIAERERAEQALRRSEQKFRGLFVHMNEGANICEVVRNDAGEVVDWIIREINPALETTAGLMPNSCVGQRGSDVLGKARVARYLPFIAHVVNAHQRVQFEAYTPELGKHLVLSFFEVQPEFFAMVSMDITERKEAIQQLQESEEKYRGLFEHMNEGMTLNTLVYDAQGAVMDWVVRDANYAMTQIIGLPSGHIIERKARELYGSEQVQAFLPLMASAAEGREPQIFEFYNPRLLRHLMISLFATGPDQVAMVAMDITERKHAEEALRESEEKYRALTETSTDIIMRFDQLFRHVYVNQAVTSFIGLQPENFLGKTHRDMGFPETMCTMTEACIARVFETGEPVATQFEAPGLEGRVVFDWRLFPEFAPDGSVRSVISSARDITALKEAEEALRSSEERFRRIVETFPGMIWMTKGDPDFSAIFLSDHVEDIYGYPKEEFLSGRLQFTDIVFPEDMERVNLAVEVALAERQPYSIELRFRHRAGHTVWVMEIGAGVYDDAGHLQYLIGTVLDITERKRTETALQESEWQYQALFAHMNEGFMLCEIVYDDLGQPVDWVVDQVNPTFNTMMGGMQTELVGEFGSVIFGSSEAIAALLPVCAHVAETGVPSRFEAEFAILGKHFVVSVFSPRIGRFAAIFYDSTARKLAEEQVRVYQRELLALASELSQAEERERRRIATDLHDSIIQNLALLQIMLGALRAQAEATLHASVDDARALLTSSIQSARTLTFELSPPILYELGLAAALEWLAEQVQQRHSLQVTVEIIGHFRLQSDDQRALLFSSVREILMNVVKHAEATTVTVTMEGTDSVVLITVADNGIGFDLAAAEARRGGYGLFSIRERLRHIGGAMHIETQPGVGTRLTLVAPLSGAVAVTLE